MGSLLGRPGLTLSRPGFTLGLLAPLGLLLGRSWPLLGSSWPLFGPSWTPLGAFWALLGPLLAIRGRLFGLSWAPLGSFVSHCLRWAVLGSLLGRPGFTFDGHGGRFGSSWARGGWFWLQFERSWAISGLAQTLLGLLLGFSWLLLMVSMTQVHACKFLCVHLGS